MGGVQALTGSTAMAWRPASGVGLARLLAAFALWLLLGLGWSTFVAGAGEPVAGAGVAAPLAVADAFLAGAADGAQAPDEADDPALNAESPDAPDAAFPLARAAGGGMPPRAWRPFDAPPVRPRWPDGPRRRPRRQPHAR